MTATQSRIRLATPADEPELLHLVRLMHAESGMFPLDIDRARETFARAFDRRGGILAVIGAPGHIRAMMYVTIATAWYTNENHLEELFCWVHPEHRHSDYSKLLIEYAKKCSDELSESSTAQGGGKISLIMGVLTNKRMSAKVRLYRRFFGIPSGAVFVHNAEWVGKNDICEEDFWRVPSLTKAFFKRTERADREKMKVRA